MATILLKAEARNEKYGIVYVRNEDKSVNRSFRITEAELAALKVKGAGAPAGVTQEEWESGRAVAAGQDMDVGDVQERDGWLRIKVDEKSIGGWLTGEEIKLPPGTWSGTLPNVTVNFTVVAGVLTSP
jgi:hypothetical protein